MRDPNAGQYDRIFPMQFKIAQLVLQPYNGTLEWLNKDFEAFRFLSDDVCLIFYPYVTTQGNTHLRVRDQHSINKARALELLVRLRIGSGHGSDFRQRNKYTFELEDKLAHLEDLRFGWAREEVYRG